MAQPVRRTIEPAKPRVPALLMRVWDAPTRAFHWAIVLLIATSWLSQHYDAMKLHLLSGYAVLTLLLFRLVWGFVGSETSRFGAFLRNPAEAFVHLRQFGRREPDREIGHNAAGGWMVLLMLAVLLVQAVTGLFAGNKREGGGPLMPHLSDAARRTVNAVHMLNFNVLVALMLLHVAAVVLYAAVKRHDLVRPMVTGKKRLPATMRQPRFAPPLLAPAVLVASALVVWLVVALG